MASEHEKKDGDSGEGADAKAGEGDPPEHRPSTAPIGKNPRSHKRGGSEPDTNLRRLVRLAGKNLAAPDTTAVERHIRRSERIQRKIGEYLADNVGSVWADLSELHARAANYAGCASPTAARWIFQLTRVGQGFRLLDGIDHWILERREG